MLTDKQIEDIAEEYIRSCGGYGACEDAIPDRDVLDFARAIEKAVMFDELQETEAKANMYGRCLEKGVSKI